MIAANIEKAKKLIHEAYLRTPDIDARDKLADATVFLDEVIKQVNGCNAKGCSYYTHYLVYYNPEFAGPRLDHEAYHAASKNCEAAQQKYLDWMNDPKNDNKPVPERLERQAAYWEKRVCA